MSSTVALKKREDHLKDKSGDTADFTKAARHILSLQTKYGRGVAAWERNEGKPHPHGHQQIATANTIAASDNDEKKGTVGLTSVNHEDLWTGVITFGGEDLYVDFDTGSADSIVNHNAYKASKTSHKTDGHWQAKYGDGTHAQGIIFYDVLNIAGLPPVAPVAIGVADSVFLKGEGKNSGISGLSFPSIANFGYKYPPWFDRLLAANVLEKPMFSFVLGKNGAELTVGGISQRAAGDPFWAAVNPGNGFWEIQNVQLNGEKLICFGDTGTTLIVGTVEPVKKLFKSLGVEEYWDKDTLYGKVDPDKIPNFTFTFGSVDGKQTKTVTLSKETAVYAKDDKKGSKKVILSVCGADMGFKKDVWILGDALLRNFVSVWDRGDNRFGIADLKEEK
ncbi:unnamed protein product [Parajaminaea phylloscopi]